MQEELREIENEKNNEVEILLLQETNEEKIVVLEKQENTDIVIRNYESLNNLPSLNGIKLIKDKSFDDIGIVRLTNVEIEKMINNIVL